MDFPLALDWLLYTVYSRLFFRKIVENERYRRPSWPSLAWRWGRWLSTLLRGWGTVWEPRHQPSLKMAASDGNYEPMKNGDRNGDHMEMHRKNKQQNNLTEWFLLHSVIISHRIDKYVDVSLLRKRSGNSNKPGGLLFQTKHFPGIFFSPCSRRSGLIFVRQCLIAPHLSLYHRGRRLAPQKIPYWWPTVSDKNS